MALPINRSGYVDVSVKVPKGYVWVRGKRLQPICRKLKITWASALTGYTKFRGIPRAVTDGVVVTPRGAVLIQEYLDDRSPKSPQYAAKIKAARARARQRKQERETEAFHQEILSAFPSCPPEEAKEIAERATEIGSGRVGRSTKADDPVRAAVVAHIRHTHTDYDAMLESAHETGLYMDYEERRALREDARRMVAPKIDAVLTEWE